jgi:hypothetical protein
MVGVRVCRLIIKIILLCTDLYKHLNNTKPNKVKMILETKKISVRKEIQSHLSHEYNLGTSLSNHSLVSTTRVYSTSGTNGRPCISSYKIGSKRDVYGPINPISNCCRDCAVFIRSFRTFGHCKLEDWNRHSRAKKVSRKRARSVTRPLILSPNSHGYTQSEGRGTIVPGKSRIPVMLKSSSTWTCQPETTAT